MIFQVTVTVEREKLTPSVEVQDGEHSIKVVVIVAVIGMVEVEEQLVLSVEVQDDKHSVVVVVV